jgi:predicted DNA-binding transcriptional regulator AlpA
MHGPRLTAMDQPNNKPTAPETPAFTLSVAQLREIVREEIQAACSPQQDADRLLSADEAATLLSVSPDWLYRQARKLPFTRKLGPKMLRFSQHGILKWLATRKLS